MNARVPVIALALLMNGCSFLGYYPYRKAPRAAPEEAANIQFPDSLGGGAHLSGPMLEALGVALNEFLPPGQAFDAHDPDKRVAACLSRRSTYEALVFQDGEDLFFGSFIPDLRRCGLDDETLDGGVVYAIDARGHVLDVR